METSGVVINIQCSW